MSLRLLQVAKGILRTRWMDVRHTGNHKDDASCGEEANTCICMQMSLVSNKRNQEMIEEVFILLERCLCRTENSTEALVGDTDSLNDCGPCNVCCRYRGLKPNTPLVRLS